MLNYFFSEFNKIKRKAISDGSSPLHSSSQILPATPDAAEEDVYEDTISADPARENPMPEEPLEEEVYDDVSAVVIDDGKLLQFKACFMLS